VSFTASGLGYKFLKDSDGTTATNTDFVFTNYVGKLLNGTVFDQSDPSTGPSSFRVNGVIKGWTEALQMMSPGDQVRIFVPSKLAYGPQGNGPAIPPNSNLIFDVELVKIAAQ
jgi:FKBP-type peptidyl-prolyl cis-trans isomerase